MVLLTLLWFIAEVVVLTFCSDCIEASGWGCIGHSAATPVGHGDNSQELHGTGDEDRGIHYERGKTEVIEMGKFTEEELHLWTPASPVLPQHGQAGELGKAVHIPPDQEGLMKEKFKLNEFNVLASDMISFNRSLTDVRSSECKSKMYPNLLPTTSIVIAFHNEAWSILMRTIWSAINRSPHLLLEEIILVDDASEGEHLGKQLEDYVATLPVPVYVLRTKKRSGLVLARLLGAKHVKGQVITFLDAHCECTAGWLEPLLARIAEHRKTVVCPIIDVISNETFEYITASDITWGGFDWKLNFRWYQVPQREIDRRGDDRTAPLRTPTMAGLFSIDREYFYELGAYDEGMNRWGGENLEMSFRVWQCGGILEIIPCSHVGDVFRDMSHYSFPGSNIVFKNSARVAEVWMDEWRGFYYLMNPAARSVDVGDVSGRRELRNRLKCKSFRWYLESVYPESQMPLNYYYLGEVRNADTQTCLETLRRKGRENLIITYCHGLGGNQFFLYTKRQQLISDENCLDGSSPEGRVKLARCHGIGGNQAWMYNTQDRTITHINTSQCLQKPDIRDTSQPIITSCDHSLGQQWVMKSKIVWQANRTVFNEFATQGTCYVAASSLISLLLISSIIYSTT